MKKNVILWLLVLLAVFGGKAQAAEITANEILDKTEAAMKEVSVITIRVSAEAYPSMVIEMDKNTGVMYVDFGADGGMWLDQNTGITYMSYEDGTCSFIPSDNGAGVDYLDFSTDTEIDRTLNLTYEGIQNYMVNGESITCYKLSALYAESEGNVQYVYYISKDTYRIVAFEVSFNGIMTETDVYDYPLKTVTIPAEIKSKAVLMDGYIFARKKIWYIVKEEEKGKPVLYVMSGDQAKGNVKIPDAVKLLGKSYEVRGIGVDAFYNNRKIKSITLGKNIRVIEKKAFYGCKKLSKVTIQSKKLKTIGKKAFYKNAKTLKFKVPKSKKAKYKKLIKKSGLKSGFTVK